MSIPRPTTTRAFTLVELIATMLVLGIAAASITPLLMNLTDSARASRERYRTIDGLHHALDRAARLLREAPPGAAGGIDLALAEPGAFELPDGRAIELLDSTLWLDPGDGSTWPLAREIDGFSLRYLQSDGVTETTDPALMQRVALLLERDGVPLTTVVYFRTAEATP